MYHVTTSPGTLPWWQVDIEQVGVANDDVMGYAVVGMGKEFVFLQNVITVVIADNDNYMYELNLLGAAAAAITVRRRHQGREYFSLISINRPCVNFCCRRNFHYNITPVRKHSNDSYREATTC